MVKKVLIAVTFLIASAGFYLWSARYDLTAKFALENGATRPVTNSVCRLPRASMTTSDGTVLRADIYRPCGSAGAPTILVRFPYVRGHAFKLLTWQYELGVGGIAHFFASRGYNVVVQGTRGRYHSDGQFYPLKHERQDGLETLAWMKQQPWFDGRFAMWGGSAFGHTQWAVADARDPKPGALNIHIASTSFRRAFRPGGAFALESTLYWALRSHGSFDVIPPVEQIDAAVAGWPLIEADDRAGKNIAFFDDWLKHKEFGPYWREIDGKDRASQTDAPVLLMAGWSDLFLPTMLKDFLDLRSETSSRAAQRSRLVIGPWVHAGEVALPDGALPPAYRPASVNYSLPWFDHHLLGKPLAKELDAPILLYVRGENTWRKEHEWPLQRARNTALYLRSDRRNGATGLSFDPPTGVGGGMSFTYDPRNPVPSRGGAMLGLRAGIKVQNDIIDRADTLYFTSNPLSQDVEMTGPVSAVLHVTTDAPNTDFFVKLLDVQPDGKVYNVTSGILRRDYPKSSQAGPEKITVELWPTSMVFKKGHRIAVMITSSDFPRFDRNPNTGGDIATETEPRPAHQTVFIGKATPSRLIVPIVPRSDGRLARTP